MSGENETHAETESEDGGISLSPFEPSYSGKIGQESAATSASQSPLPSSAFPAHTSSVGSSSEAGGIFSSLAPSIMEGTDHDSTQLPSLTQLGITANYTPPLNPMSPHEASFAQALSGELLNVPIDSSFPGEEEAHDPVFEPAGMPQALSHSTPASPSLFATYEGDFVVDTNDGAQLHDLEQQIASHLTHDSADADGQSSASSLPSLTDAFALDFLTQTAEPFHAQVTADAVTLDPLEEFADFWDEMEDSVKNLNCDGFFNYWKTMYAHRTPHYPRISELAYSPEKVQKRERIVAEDLESRKSDSPDFQGIHWARFQTTKEAAREVRRMTYGNHINHTDPSAEQPYARLVSNQGLFGSQGYKMEFSKEAMAKTDVHFEFKETNRRLRSYISHFQLRHGLFASSKNALFYNRHPALGHSYGAYVELGTYIDAKIMSFNPETSSDECVMDFTKSIDRDAPVFFRPSTLNAGHGVLVVGSFEGAYAMKSLAASFEAKPVMGTITKLGQTSSTNHIQNFLDRRSGLPRVAFSSNDKTIRILDCTTNKFVGEKQYFPYEVNCSAVSPDGRMRLLVGDHCQPIVANADTGEQIAQMEGHGNFGFACDWAPDGITMATGHQDGFVRVWDVRKLSECAHSIAMEMAGSRTLQFSPLGSGQRVLVIAETGDFVHVVNAQTFKSKQVIEFFGEIAGISMPPDGSSLYIANQDSRYGGLMEFERSWRGSVQSQDAEAQRPAYGVNDWLPDSDLDDDPRVVLSHVRRHRRDFGARELAL